MSTEEAQTVSKFSKFIRKPEKISARELLDNEVVECYNGTKIGQKGDFVVVDSCDRVMIIRKDRFRKNFMGVS